jgi:hypothetical protein
MALFQDAIRQGYHAQCIEVPELPKRVDTLSFDQRQIAFVHASAHERCDRSGI